MNWLAVFFRLVRLIPQINQLWSLAAPIVSKGAAVMPETLQIVERVKNDLRRLEELLSPVIDDVRRVEPKAWPLIKQVADAIDPELMKNVHYSPPTVAVKPEYDTKWLQSALNALGAKLQVDGDYGENTREAVRAFQKKHGLAADGWAGIETSAALHEALEK